MNRHVVAGMLGLALAGCAQSRSALPDRGGTGTGPVGLSSFPSIHDTINGENPQVNPASLRAGVVPHAGEPGKTTTVCFDDRTSEATPTPVPSAGPAPRAEPSLPAEVVPVSQPAPESEPAPASPASAAPIQLEQVNPADPAPAPAAAPAESLAPAVPAATPAEPGSMPPAAPGPEAGGPEVPPASIAGSPPSQDGPAPPADDAGTPGPPAADPATQAAPETVPPVALPPTQGESKPEPAGSAAPGEPAPGPAAPATPSGELPPPEEAPSAPRPLGDEPPSLPPPAAELPAAPPVAAPSPPEGPGAGVEPEKGPAAPPASGADPEPPPIPSMLPPAQAEPPPVEAPQAANTSSAPKVDANVQTTGGDASSMRLVPLPRNAQTAGKVAATVGDEVITANELRRAVQERLRGLPPGQSPTEQELMMLAASVLQDLIERSVIVQDAKRELKNPKQLQLFMENADRVWQEEEIPPMLRRMSATNEYELKEKLKQEGVSLDEMRESFRRQFLSQGYMKAKLGAKLTVSLPEMRRYYNEHLKEFDRPALVVWREIVIETDKCASRAEARGKADAVLARLRRGEDFAKLAESESHGPNRIKGGIWETSPGGYAVDAVNAALDSLPTGRISQIIEGPSSYHIVRVESRRAAGPASFAEAEVQDKIKRAVFDQKARHETTAYLDKLRSRTLITSMFDRPENAPANAPR